MQQPLGLWINYTTGTVLAGILLAECVYQLPNNTQGRAVNALLIAAATVAATRVLVKVFKPLPILCTALKKKLQ